MNFGDREDILKLADQRLQAAKKRWPDAALLDPDAVVLGGGMSNVDELYQRLPDEILQYTFTTVFTTPIVKSRHGDSSGVRGAAWLWAEE